MSEERTESGFGFRIRPLQPRGEPAPMASRAQPAVPPPATTDAPTDASTGAPAAAPSTARARARAQRAEADAAALAHSAGLFARAQSAIAFLGAAAAAGLATEASARRGPQGRFWVEMPARWEAAAGLVANAGGRAYAGRGGHWTAVPADGSAPVAKRRTGHGRDRGASTILLDDGGSLLRLEPDAWPEVGLAALLTATPLRRARPGPCDSAVVVAPGVLARTILRRAVAQGLEVTAGSALREPLGGGVAAAVSCLVLRWPGRSVPRAFLHAVQRLPLVAVARPVGTGADADVAPALLVDFQHAVPLSGMLMAGLVPPGEQWLLGGPAVGHWRLRALGRSTDAADMIELPPAADATAATPALPASPHRAALPLRLVQRPAPAGHPDAVLLDDEELGWLRDYLIGKPEAETAYLLLGPGRHVLMAPGGMLSRLPLGIGLRRIGPGGVYLQEGRALSPPLPETARARAFRCDEGELLAITQAPAGDALALTRLSIESLAPVWTLWLPDAPTVSEGVSGTLAQGVGALAATLSPKPASRLKEVGERLLGPLARRPAADREQLLREALLLEHRGRLAEAAQCLEKAGELAAAGRLYERAAHER